MFMAMKVEYSPILSQASGSLGEITAATNRYGSYFRHRNGPDMSTNAFWQVIKARTAAVIVEWQELSYDAQVRWSEASGEISKSYAFGKRSTLPGYNYFLHVNTNRNLFLLGSVYEPPVRSHVEMPNFVVDSSAQEPESLVVSLSPLPASHIYLKLFSTPTFSPGQNFFTNRLGLTVAAQGLTIDGYDMYTDWYDRFLDKFDTGCRIFFKAILFDSVSCCLSEPQFSSLIIP